MFSRYFKLKVAVSQFTATDNVLRNTKLCKQIINTAAKNGAQIVCLPEASDFIASSGEQIDELTIKESDLFIQELKKLSIEHEISIFVGHHEVSNQPQRQFNTLTSIHKHDLQQYRKIHLFDVDLRNSGGPALLESKYTVPGTHVVDPVKIHECKFGLAICYDMRFPELSVALRNSGADVILFPSAFTIKTGRDKHWEILLRARAIESQCYIVASAQVGNHNEKRSSWGEALIVDPWGNLLAKCPSFDELEKPLYKNTIKLNQGQDSCYLAFANIESDIIDKIRNNMPIVKSRQQRLWKPLICDPIQKNQV